MREPKLDTFEDRLRRSSMLQDSEMTTALLRVTAGAAMLVMYVTGGLPDPSGWAAEALVVASVYAVTTGALVYRRFLGADPYPTLLTWTLTFFDNAIILGLAAITGGVGSLIVAILLLVVTTTAARYGVLAAVWCALADSAALAAMALAVEDPDGLADRVRLATWWSWLLVGGAVIAGITARAAFAFRAQLLVATHQAAIDRYERSMAESAREKLEIAAEGRRDFLRVVTHELRTPISSIGALSRALGPDRADLDPAQRTEFLGLLRSHAEHLQDLLDSVRDLSQDAPSERPPLHLSTIDVAEVVRSSASAAGLSAARLHVDVADSLQTLRTDREKLRRILTNLIENAGRQSRETVEVEVRPDAQTVLVSVADRGTGLTAEVAERVFDKGFTMGGERDSSGLGLWIVRELADALGGTVWAESRDGGGLTVHVRFPLAPDASREIRPPERKAQMGAPTIKSWPT